MLDFELISYEPTYQVKWGVIVIVYIIIEWICQIWQKGKKK
jgi:hypothetical protein